MIKNFITTKEKKLSYTRVMEAISIPTQSIGTVSVRKITFTKKQKRSIVLSAIPYTLTNQIQDKTK